MRALAIIFSIVGILFGMHGMKLINLDCSYFGRSIVISYFSYWSVGIIPLLLIPLFIKKTFKVTVFIIVFIQLFCLTYGLVVVGLLGMLTQYWLLTTVYIIIPVALFFLIYRMKYGKEKR